jgi:NADH-quinone oxidoreductase subunit N
MWVPDVYQGAPTAITLMIGGAPKLAAFAMMMRLLVDGLLPLAIDWQQMLMVLAVVTLLIGNFVCHCPNQSKAHVGVFNHCPNGFCLDWHVVWRGEWQHAVRS